MILAAASALHGHNTLRKGDAVCMAAALYALVGYLCGSPAVAAAGALLSVLWWVALRRSRQENIENDYMHQGGKGSATLWQVMRAHYYTGALSCLALCLFNYSTEWGKKLGWEMLWVQQGHVRGKKVRSVPPARVHPDDRPFWDCRRPTEIAGGLTGDIMIGCLLCLMNIL